MMNKRQAKIEALGFAASLLRADVDASDEMYEEWGKDGDKVHRALQTVIEEIENRRRRLEQYGVAS